MKMGFLSVRLEPHAWLCARLLVPPAQVPAPGDSTDLCATGSLPASRLLLTLKRALDASLSSAEVSVLVTDSAVYGDIFIQRKDRTEKTSQGNWWGCSLAKAEQLPAATQSCAGFASKTEISRRIKGQA